MGSHHARRLTEEEKIKLDEGKPVYLEGGLKITKNKETGEFEGIPEEWVKNYDLPIKVNMGKTIKTKHMREEIRPECDLPDSIIHLINSQDEGFDFSAYSFSHSGQPASPTKCTWKSICLTLTASRACPTSGFKKSVLPRSRLKICGRIPLV